MLFTKDCVIYTKEGYVNSGSELIDTQTRPFKPDQLDQVQLPHTCKFIRVTSKYGVFELDAAGYVAVFDDIVKIKLKPVRKLTVNDLLVNIPYRLPDTDSTSWKVWWLRGFTWAANRYTIIRLPSDTPYKLLITEALYDLGIYTAYSEGERTLKWYFNQPIITDTDTIIRLGDRSLRAFLAGAHLGSPWRPDGQDHQMALSSLKEKLDLAQKLYFRLGIHTTVRYGDTGTIVAPASRVQRRKVWLSVESRICQQLWLARVGTFLADEAFSPLKAMRVTHSIPAEMALKHANLSRTVAHVAEKYIEWERVIQRYRVPNCWLPVPIKQITTFYPAATETLTQVKASRPFIVDGIVVASEPSADIPKIEVASYDEAD